MLTVGVGLTVMVNVVELPVQPKLGVIKLPNACGTEPTVTVLITALVMVLITETLFDPKLVTYAFVASAVKETPCGFVPTAIVFVTALVLALITVTLLEF